MDDNLANSYIKLYNQVIEKNKTNSKYGTLTICPAIKGEKYENGGIMFVGRAVNGWCPLEGSVENNDIIARLERCEKCTLDWVKGENVWEHCVDNKCPFADGKKIDGRVPNSPFWQMVKHICEKNDIFDEWYKKIVWSNLYKSSYIEGGNPVDFYEEQIDFCNEILIEEIDVYKPSKIYFITENNGKKNRTWFCEEYKQNQKINFKKVYEKLYKNKNIEVYILTRPEFKNKDEIYAKRENLIVKK